MGKGLIPRFSGKSGESEETAESVRKHYADQIDHFLSRFETWNPLRRRHNHLGELFTFADGIWKEKEQLEQQINHQKGRLQRAERENQRLRSELERKEQECEQYEHQLLTSTKQHSQDLDDARQEHVKEVRRLNEGHANEARRLSEEHADEVRRLNEGHAKEAQQLNRRIKQLVGDLLVNQEDSRAWTDEKLKLRFVELRKLLNDVTSPHHLTIRETTEVCSLIDPTGFICHGNAMYHFPLKSSLWSILLEQFFSTSFGFGALGPGNGAKSLLGVYSAWRKLFNDTREAGKL
jgi:hypothetical protein